MGIFSSPKYVQKLRNLVYKENILNSADKFGSDHVNKLYQHKPEFLLERRNKQTRGRERERETDRDRQTERQTRQEKQERKTLELDIQTNHLIQSRIDLIVVNKEGGKNLTVC